MHASSEVGIEVEVETLRLLPVDVWVGAWGQARVQSGKAHPPEREATRMMARASGRLECGSSLLACSLAMIGPRLYKAQESKVAAKCGPVPKCPSKCLFNSFNNFCRFER